MFKLMILGMHRSGTSIVTEQLCRAGLYIGESTELLAPQADNPRGFWERRDVVELNDRLLADAGGSWYSPPAAEPAATEQQRQQMAGIVSALDPAAPWVIKDPRLTLTWSAWEPELADVQQLLVFRDPLAVAMSLQARHGFPLTLGLALWEYYNRCALSRLNHNALLVSHDWLVAEPQPRVRWLLETLQQGAGAEILDTHCECLLQPRSAGSGSHQHEALLSASQRELLALLQGASGISPGPIALPDGDDARLLARIHDLSAALAPLATAREAQLGLQALQDEKRQLERELNTSREAALQLEAERGKLSEEAARLSQEREELDQHLARAYQQVLSHEISLIGRLQGWQHRLYRGTLRRGKPPGAYADLVADARNYFRSHRLALPERIPGKFCQLMAVCRYLLRHPVSSIRGFSLFRLKRALEVLFTSSPADFNVWIRSRFPEEASPGGRVISAALEPALDQLQLQFPAIEQPRVSIILPVFNNYRMTMHCLSSLLEQTRDVDYEVIIADDASTDLTASIHERVSNVRVVRQQQNRGFLHNCNAAAVQARGDYLLLLNNDTAVGENWLAPLVALLDTHSDIGVTGPRLLFPDGKLQEAGGIVWQDGSGWNYGRGDDPQKPEYEYVKEVDYISGACLLVRRSLWRELDGFDTRYAPAYYEDTDLCSTLR